MIQKQSINYFNLIFAVCAISIFSFSATGQRSDFQPQLKAESRRALEKQSNQHKSFKLAAECSTLLARSGIFANAEKKEFYAAPEGSAAGDGSINAPWDLKTALSKHLDIVSGTVLWLRGGVYRFSPADSGLVSILAGTEQDPVQVASYPGEWAVLDGNSADSEQKNKTILTISGDYVWFTNFEITNTETGNRKIADADPNAANRRGNSIDDYGTGTKLINLIIHDTGQGIGAWSNGRDNEYYGNVIYNNGWDAPDSLKGHGVYAQNERGFKRFENNFFFNSFGFNSQTGGSSAASVRNFTWSGNVFFNGLMAWQGPNIENLKAYGNYTFDNPFKVGFDLNTTYLNADIQDNYLMSGAELFEFSEKLTFKNNTVWNRDPAGKNVTLLAYSFYFSGKFIIDNNTYYKAYQSFPFWHFAINYYGEKNKLLIIRKKIGDLAFNQTSGSQKTTFKYTGKSWQDNLRFDRSGDYIDESPTGLNVFINRNKYDDNRANIIVYNWSEADSVSIDFEGIFKPGDSYELHNVQDYFGDVTRGTVPRDGQLQISMNGRSRVKPIGYDEVTEWYHEPLKPNTYPIFGAFVIVKTNNYQQPLSNSLTACEPARGDVFQN